MVLPTLKTIALGLSELSYYRRELCSFCNRSDVKSTQVIIGGLNKKVRNSGMKKVHVLKTQGMALQCQ